MKQVLKGVWAIPVIVSILILGVIGFSFSQDAEAASIIFTTDTTITTNTFIAFGDTWTVNPGVTLTINFGVTITSNGIINNSGTITNLGTIINGFNNFATINNSGTIDNFGTIDNTNGIINNSGTINNFFSSTIDNLGNGIIILTGSGLIKGAGSITAGTGGIIVDPSLIQRIAELEAALISGEITICHGDKTKTISVAAFGTHVGHGDTEGACT